MSDWFKPDVVRSDVELTFTNLYYPAVYSSTVSYVAGDRVRSNGLVYEANQATIGSTPPSANWDLVGPSCKILYENVSSTLDSLSARIQLSWGGTTRKSVYAPDGILREVDGAIGIWIFTPKNQGTSPGLKLAARMRETLNLWKRLGTCGEQVMIYDVNGPRSVDSVSEDTHFVQLLSASLMVLEKAA